VNQDDRADLVSHLDELRTRILRSAAYLCVTATLAACYFRPIYRFIAHPILSGAKAAGGRFNVPGVLEPFMLRLWVAVLGGLVLALPFIYLEVWGFVRPGLTPRERRAVAPLAPCSSLLFAAGVALAYLIADPCVRWMLSLRPPGTDALLSLNDTVVLFLKFYITCGIGFQLPIVMILLSSLGLVSSRVFTRFWREATVGIFIVVAIITPTWDPITMTVAALPMVLLYLGTISIIKVIERRRRRRAAEEEKALGSRS